MARTPDKGSPKGKSDYSLQLNKREAGSYRRPNVLSSLCYAFEFSFDADIILRRLVNWLHISQVFCEIGYFTANPAAADIAVAAPQLKLPSVCFMVLAFAEISILSRECDQVRTPKRNTLSKLWNTTFKAIFVRGNRDLLRSSESE